MQDSDGHLKRTVMQEFVIPKNVSVIAKGRCEKKEPSPRLNKEKLPSGSSIQDLATPFTEAKDKFGQLFAN